MNKKEKPASVEAAEKSQLSAHTPKELDDSDKKIAKKMAKKRGISVEEAEHVRFVIANKQRVEELWHEFNEKMFALGHVIEPILQQGKNFIKANFNFRPLEIHELAGVKVAVEKAKKEIDAMKASEEKIEKENPNLLFSLDVSENSDYEVWCCRDREGFVDLQTSVAGFGDTKAEALANYKMNLDREKNKEQNKSEPVKENDGVDAHRETDAAREETARVARENEKLNAKADQ